MLIAAAALFAGAVPATASVLFTDLGSDPNNVYDTSGFWNVCGSSSMAPACSTGSSTIAAEFLVAGSGNQPVDQIDFAVSNIFGANTFTVQILNDNGGIQGGQVLNATWTIATNLSVGTCCDLVSIKDILNVSLIGGQKYFLSVGPLDGSDDSWNAWADSNQNTAGSVITGSSNTVPVSASLLPAFDVIGGAAAVPEPGTWMLMLTGAAILSCRRIRGYRIAGRRTASLARDVSDSVTRSV